MQFGEVSHLFSSISVISTIIVVIFTHETTILMTLARRTPAAICPRRCQSNRVSWRGSNARRPLFSRERLSGRGNGNKAQSTSGGLPLLRGRTKAGARRRRRGRRRHCVPGHELQAGQTCERRGAPPGGSTLLPTTVRQVGRAEGRMFVASPDESVLEVSTAKSDMVRDLLGNAGAQQAPDDHARLADDRHVLSPQRTLAVRARGSHQVHARRCEQFRPSSSTPCARAFQARCKTAMSPSIWATKLALRTPKWQHSYSRPHIGVSGVDTHVRLAKRCPLQMPPLGSFAGRSRQTPHDVVKKRGRWKSRVIT